MAYNLPSALRCELIIIKAKNLEFVPSGNLFVRCSLVDGNGFRIRLNSGEIASTTDPVWNEHVSLECQGAGDTAGALRKQSVVFELRWRSTAPVISRVVRSKLLGRAEIAWKEVVESKDMAIEKWVTLAAGRSGVVGLKPPALKLGMKVGVVKEEETESRKVGSNRWKECSCRDCAYGTDDEIFTIAAALDVF